MPPIPSAPYATTLDTSLYPAGQHVLRARATDTSGNVSAWSTALVQIGGATTRPNGFTRNEAWLAGLASATAFAQAPDGRLFVAEQGGALRVVKNGALLATPFATVAVDSAGERGLIGVALHPGFATNGFVYIYSTRSAGGVSHNRISRFTAAGDVAAAGSEVALVDLPNLSGATNHNGGGMHFGADGKLYVGVGDNANGAQAQNLALPFGKLLRFNDDGSIPTDNPFFATQAGFGRAVWAYGLRNPYTFAVQPGTGRIHINDVGETTWEEIDVGSAGANYGWPASEGPDNVGAGVTAPLFTYKHADAAPPGSGAGRLLQGLRDRRRRVLSGGRSVPRRLSRPVLLRRLRQPLRRPDRPRQRQRRLRVRDAERPAGRPAGRRRRRDLRADAQRRDAHQRALIPASASVAADLDANGQGRGTPDRVGDRRASAGALDERAQAVRRDAVGGDADRERHVERTRRDDFALVIGHAEHAAQVRTAGHLDLEPGQGDALVRGLQRDRRRRARSDAGAKEPPRRDAVAAAGELRRHVGRHLGPVGVRAQHSRAALPPRRRRRIVVQALLGPALQHRLDPLHRCCHRLHRHRVLQRPEGILNAVDGLHQGPAAAYARTLGQALGTNGRDTRPVAGCNRTSAPNPRGNRRMSARIDLTALRVAATGG